MRQLNIFQYFTTFLALLSSTIIAHSQLPKNTKQVVIGIAPNHNKMGQLGKVGLAEMDSLGD